jgi:hypothetical protein
MLEWPPLSKLELGTPSNVVDDGRVFSVDRRSSKEMGIGLEKSHPIVVGSAQPSSRFTPIKSHRSGRKTSLPIPLLYPAGVLHQRIPGDG